MYFAILTARYSYYKLIHASITIYYNNFGNAFDSLSQNSDAILFYNKAYSLRLKILGFKNIYTQESLLCIVAVFAKDQPHQKLIDYFNNLESTKDWPLLTKSDFFNWVGVEKAKKNLFKESIYFFKLAFNYTEKSMDPERIRKKIALLINLAESYCLSDKKTESLRYFKEARDLCKNTDEKDLAALIERKAELCGSK